MIGKHLNLAENDRDLIHNQKAHQLLENPLLKKDIWDTINDLKLKVDAHNRCLTLNFRDFSIAWFKLLVKLYILVIAKPGKPANTLNRQISDLKRFSQFLESQSISNPQQISNQIFEAFDNDLHSRGLKETTIYSNYKSLSNFFRICSLEGWLDVNTYWFQGRKKPNTFPKNDGINYIPEEVWQQLDQNLHYLPEPLQRMILVLRTFGLRVGELCNLPFDCLRKRGEEWRIRLTTEKYNIEDELPIVALELVAVIQEQQKYIRQHLGKNYDNLFCGSKAYGGKGIRKYIDEMVFEPYPEVMAGKTFNKWLNRLGKKCKICSKNGELWHFQSHQFRRTVATVMTNAGVRDLIIQKYLRHRSPEMLNYYKHLLTKVLGSELEELMQSKKYVDITGKVVASHQPKNPVTELLRRRMYQITTQYGECHRPVLKAPCQTVNACWRCKEWRTSTDDLPYLKDDLKRVEEELKIAQSLGMVRQQQGLEDDRESLVKRIVGLEEL